MNWRRVTAKECCPVCQKPDWCAIGQRWVNCMRVASERTCINGGWLHLIGSTTRPAPTFQRAPDPSPPLNVEAIMTIWRAQTKLEWIEQFAMQLGVAPAALSALGCVWASDHNAWAFPMCDGQSKQIGIRLRTLAGKKFAITGSHSGVFVPSMPAQRELIICEGPSDTAAALTLGFFAMGRPSCLGQEAIIYDFIRIQGVRRVIICADHDDPGQQGAERLQAALKVPSIIFTPPGKDIREAVQNGLTREIMLSLTKDLLWTSTNKTI